MRCSRLAVALMAALLLVGCGTTTSATASNTSTSHTAKPTVATSRLCQKLTTINQSLTQLATVGDNTTVGEVKAIQQKITAALGVFSRLPGNAGAALSDLQTANTQLAVALQDQPDSATMGEVGPRLQTVKGKVTQAQTAATKLTAVLRCGA